MAEVSFVAVIGAKAYSNDGVGLLKRVYTLLAKSLDIVSISSVYKIHGTEVTPIHTHDLRKVTDFEGTSVASKVMTSLVPEELLKLLEKVEAECRSEVLHRNVSLNLLLFENKTVMLPQITLPHPKLYERPELLFPAAEVWGNYHHPVHNETLQGMTRRFANTHWGEFLQQGKTLLDF